MKAAWLNVPFFWARTLVLAAALFRVAYAFIGRLLRDPVPPDEERERARRNRLATVLLFLWIITLSLWGFDLLMSLDPKWYSGLFGGYFVVTALYTGFATALDPERDDELARDASIPAAAVQDVAKLQFAMSVMWMYFFWSQYLVIWYGNVPIETRFFVRRFFVQPWQTLAWVIFVIGWLIPFAYLLKRLTGRPPQRHTPLVVVARPRPRRDLPRARPRRLPDGVGGQPAAPRVARLLITAGFLGPLRPEPAVVHGSLQARPEPAAHGGALATWGVTDMEVHATCTPQTPLRASGGVEPRRARVARH